MSTLLDLYAGGPPGPVGKLCQRTGSSTRVVSTCGGIIPGVVKGRVILYLFDLLTGQKNDHDIPLGGLRDFKMLAPNDLNHPETQALDQMIDAYARTCVAFAEFARERF